MNNSLLSKGGGKELRGISGVSSSMSKGLEAGVSIGVLRNLPKPRAR